MYLRITRARFDPASLDEVLPLARELNTAIQGLPGYQGFYQGIDRKAGTVAAVSVWDTEAHARFSRDLLGDPMRRLQALAVQLDPPELYEIAS